MYRYKGGYNNKFKYYFIQIKKTLSFLNQELINLICCKKTSYLFMKLNFVGGELEKMNGMRMNLN